MKTIEPIQIWNNGQVKTASVFDATANVMLNNCATFNYNIYSIENNILSIVTSGSIYMNPDIYQTWEQDDIAWDFVANSLNLIITGNYIAPQPPIVQEPVIEAFVKESAIESPSNSL